MNSVIEHLRKTAIRGGAAMTDGQLLEHFLARRDEAALAALVRRHAPMVWRVCRHLLHNHHEAEDAFQATFLVLVRRAASIQPRDMVANWLYGVARQTALNARMMEARRKSRERQVDEMPEPAVKGRNLSSNLGSLLDQELTRLPAKYRVAIVLCDLNGTTRKQAARQLGVPEGTLSGWLTRGRTMLAKRLARSGLTVSGGALAAALAQPMASAGVPASIVTSTIRAATLFAAGNAAATAAISAKATALAEGVLKAMWFTKIKVVGVSLLLAAAVGLLGNWLSHRPLAAGEPIRAIALQKEGEQQPAARRDKPGASKSRAEAKGDRAALQGIWTGYVAELGGRPLPENFQDQVKVHLLVKGGEMVLRGPTLGTVIAFGSPRDTAFTFQLGETKKPKSVDLTIPKAADDLQALAVLGLYDLNGEKLRLCLNAVNKQRPAEMKTQERTAQMLIVLKRDPQAKWEPLPDVQLVPPPAP